MSKSLVILGRQPALGLAELESILGSDKIKPVGDTAALLDVHHSEVPFSRLGGSIKLAKLLHEFESSDWKQIEKYLLKNLPKHLQYTDEGAKLNIGLSVFGLKVSTKQLLASGLTVKKTLKATGKSVRLVPNKTPALNSAQVRSNKLFGANGWELIFIADGRKVIMGLTTQEQDIDAYATRDHGRPKRDPQVGMLPPKLAQVIINLAVGPRGMILPQTTPLLADTDTDDFENYIPSAGSLLGLLDPFCGTGVILQEALLMGMNVIGSDIDQRMFEYASENLRWLDETVKDRPASGLSRVTLVADATSYEWPVPFYTIACETYLGRPFSHQPDPETLQKVMQDVDTIHRKFLQNVARQTREGFRMCIAVPAWFIKSGVRHLKTLDSLEELGYNRLSFVHAANKDLIYHREGQVVGRELVVLQRK